MGELSVHARLGLRGGRTQRWAQGREHRAPGRRICRAGSILPNGRWLEIVVTRGLRGTGKEWTAPTPSGSREHDPGHTAAPGKPRELGAVRRSKPARFSDARTVSALAGDGRVPADLVT